MTTADAMGAGPVHTALTFDVDGEEVWLADDPDNARRPGVLSQGRYDYTVGVPEVLRVLSEHEAPATFFVPGRVAERIPHLVERMLEDGHEVAHHGYTHTSPTALSPDAELDELLRGKEVLERLGATVSGYRSPSWDFSPETLRLLEHCQLGYSSNLMDDIRPYRHAGTDIVELPVSWLLDDAAHFWFDLTAWTRKIATTDEVWNIWTEEYLGYQHLRGAFTLTMHPQIMGRPSRLRLLSRFIEWLRADDQEAHLVTCAQMVARYRAGSPTPDRTDDPALEERPSASP